MVPAGFVMWIPPAPSQADEGPELSPVIASVFPGGEGRGHLFKFMSCFSAAGRGQRAFPVSASSQLPSAQKRAYARVACFGFVCSAALQPAAFMERALHPPPRRTHTLHRSLCSGPGNHTHAHLLHCLHVA